MNAFRSIEFLDSATVRLLDQRKLPRETVYNDYENYTEIAQAIKDMVIRGAPAIAVAASYGIAQTALRSEAVDVDALKSELDSAMDLLSRSRPTAVNLFWAIARFKDRISDPALDNLTALKEAMLAEAHAIAKEDVLL